MGISQLWFFWSHIGFDIGFCHSTIFSVGWLHFALFNQSGALQGFDGPHFNVSWIQSDFCHSTFFSAGWLHFSLFNHSGVLHGVDGSHFDLSWVHIGFVSTGFSCFGVAHNLLFSIRPLGHFNQSGALQSFPRSLLVLDCVWDLSLLFSSHFDQSDIDHSSLASTFGATVHCNHAGAAPSCLSFVGEGISHHEVCVFDSPVDHVAHFNQAGAIHFGCTTSFHSLPLSDLVSSTFSDFLSSTGSFLSVLSFFFTLSFHAVQTAKGSSISSSSSFSIFSSFLTSLSQDFPQPFVLSIMKSWNPIFSSLFFTLYQI